MSPQDLRATAEEAIRTSTEERRKQDAKRERAEMERRTQGEENKARLIIQQITERTSLEARTGRYHAIIMSVDREERGSDTVMDELPRCDPETLKGTAAIVYRHCANEGFNPTLEYWHDGLGYTSGYNIVVHW